MEENWSRLLNSSRKDERTAVHQLAGHYNAPANLRTPAHFPGVLPKNFRSFIFMDNGGLCSVYTVSQLALKVEKELRNIVTTDDRDFLLSSCVISFQQWLYAVQLSTYLCGAWTSTIHPLADSPFLSLSSWYLVFRVRAHILPQNERFAGKSLVWVRDHVQSARKAWLCVLVIDRGRVVANVEHK